MESTPSTMHFEPQFEQQQQQQDQFPADVVGVIAGFIAPITSQQRRLMLVSHTWYQGVVQQDGMKPRPQIKWPPAALKQRQPSRLRFKGEKATTEDLIKLASAVPSTQGLALSCDGATLAQITKQFKALTHLELRSLDFTHEDLSAMLFEQQITSHSSQESSSSSSSATAFSAGQLKYLDVAYNNHLTVAALKHIGTSVVNLTHLDVSCSYSNPAWVTDEGLQVVTTNLKKLASLKLRHCDQLTDVGARHLANVASTLTELDVCGCDQLSDIGLQKGVSKLRKLVQLDLQDCVEITSVGVAHICSGNKKLTALNIADCYEIDLTTAFQCLNKLSKLASLTSGRQQLAGSPLGDEQLEQLKDSLKNSITTLNFRHCDSITDNGLQHLAAMHQLAGLELFGCTAITDVGMQWFAKIPRLETLILSSVPLVTDVGLKHVAGCRRLRTLEISDSDRITDVGVEFCAKQLEKETLQFMSLIRCGQISKNAGCGLKVIICFGA